MGTIIRNGIEYGGGISPDIEDKINNAKGIELTQAEYNALSEEVQKTGLYWITDADSESSSVDALTSDDVVNNLESTETKLPLSANMGRELKENIFKTRIVSNISVLSVTQNGKYYIGNALDLPSGVGVYGYLDVHVYDDSGALRKITWTPAESNTTYTNIKVNDNWLGWEELVKKSNSQNGTVTCSFVNSTTLYGQITHNLGDSYNCIATPNYVGDNPLVDVSMAFVFTVRHNNLTEFFVKGDGFTNDSGIYVDFLLIKL